MWANQNAGLTHTRIRCRTDSPDPFRDELGLIRSDELRRAEVEEERLVRREADLAAELLPTGARPALEPLVVDRCAGDADVLRRHAMHRDRFALLGFVPDEHAIRQNANQPLVRQVVPAVDTQPAADAQRARRLDVVDLIGAQVHQGRNQDNVRVL